MIVILFLYMEIHQNFQLGQRWKDVQDGRWIKNSSTNKADGIRGEYWILGENENGSLIHNHKFPVDIEPPTPPTAWRFAIIRRCKVILD